MRYLTLVLMLLCTIPVAAQDTLEPVYFFYENAVYRWTEPDGVQQVGEPFEHLRSLTVSPDSSTLAYQVLTDAVIEECFGENGGCGGGTLPTNLWLMDLNTAERRMIAGQTAEGQDIARSVPVWSPDSRQLAWVDGFEGGDLMVYDLGSGETREIAQGLPVQQLNSAPTRITAWTDAGILVDNVDFDDDLKTVNLGYLVYDPFSGDVRQIDPLAEHHDHQFLVNDQGTPSLLLDVEKDWQILNLLTGEHESLSGGELVNYAAGHFDTSLRLGLPVLQDDGDTAREVFTPDGALITTLEGNSWTFSPSGQAIITRSEGTQLTLWTPEGETTVELPWQPTYTLWGRQATALQRGGDQVITAARCEGGTLPFHMMRGYAHVAGTAPNNLRTEPGLDSEVLFEIEAGDWFEVTGGPRCADGIAWWEVNYAGAIGWTAEGQGDTYWIEPGCPPQDCARG